jgi:hypothetical protein
MSWADGAGLIGVFLMLAAYAAAQIMRSIRSRRPR